VTRRRLPVLFGVARVGLVAAFVLLGLHAHRALVLDGLPLHADEAGHALPAARMALALGQGDLPGFASASLRELVWPFMHPWVIASFFLVFGISAHVARVSSLLTFGAALCLLPSFARAISPKDAGASGAAPPMLGWLSAAILVTAAPWDLVCTVIGRAPRDVPHPDDPLGGRSRGRWPPPRRPQPSAASWRGRLLTKYGYGVPLIAAVLLALAWRIREVGRRPFLAALVGALVPIAGWACAVFAREPHRVDELLASW